MQQKIKSLCDFSLFDEIVQMCYNLIPDKKCWL